MLLATKQLITSLSESKISYCHWKSNMLIKEALDGYDDLDLLVSKEDYNTFLSILFNLGYVEAENVKTATPSVRHYYIYDAPSDKVLHLHVYTRLLSGASWIKDLALSVENEILNNTIIHESGMPLINIAQEKVIYILRCMFKYALPNEILLINREKERVTQELKFLSINKEAELQFLSSFFPSINEGLYNACEESITSQNKWKLFRLGRKIKRKIKNQNRYTALGNLSKNITQLSHRVGNKLFSKKKKNLKNGGILISVVGLDASGKSTITESINKTLRKNFTTHLIHFGKPPSALITSPLNLLISIIRKKNSDSKLKSSISQKDKKVGFIYALRQLVLAYDRHTLISKYWRKAINGEIVICDRYKSQEWGVMDSPRLNPSNQNGLTLKMAHWENNLYAKMPKPDLIIKLVVPIEVAVTRNAERIKEGKESEKVLRQRHDLNSNLSYSCDHIIELNTNQDFNPMIANLKQSIWKYL